MRTRTRAVVYRTVRYSIRNYKLFCPIDRSNPHKPQALSVSVITTFIPSCTNIFRAIPALEVQWKRVTTPGQFLYNIGMECAFTSRWVAGNGQKLPFQGVGKHLSYQRNKEDPTRF